MAPIPSLLHTLFGKSKLSPQRVVLQLYRMNTAKAGSICLDQDLRIHDVAEMSLRRRNPLVTLGNVAMLAAAAGIATALCREVQVHRTHTLHPICIWLAQGVAFR